MIKTLQYGTSALTDMLYAFDMYSSINNEYVRSELLIFSMSFKKNGNKYVSSELILSTFSSIR
jgi:hypothetical protein